MLAQFGIHERRSWLVVEVTGEIDLSNADLMKSEIDAAIESGAPRVAVDLRGVGFMDSTGLRVLIGAHQKLRAADRDFAIVSKAGPVERLFEITAVDTSLPIHSELPASD